LIAPCGAVTGARNSSLGRGVLRIETIPQEARAMAALLVLHDKAIKPLLAAAQQHRRSRPPQNPAPLDIHYQAIRASMRGVFHELGIAAGTATIIFPGFASKGLRA
jgi:hypothetical protein